MKEREHYYVMNPIGQHILKMANKIDAIAKWNYTHHPCMGHEMMNQEQCPFVQNFGVWNLQFADDRKEEDSL